MIVQHVSGKPFILFKNHSTQKVKTSKVKL